MPADDRDHRHYRMDYEKVQIPAVLIILILVWFEFPYLYYCYGDASIVYLVLGSLDWRYFPEKCGDRFFCGHVAGISGDHDEQL